MRHPLIKVVHFAAAAMLSLTGAPSFAAGLGVVTVYTHRHYEVDQKIFDAFTRQTGIKVQTLKGDADQLLQRIKAEGSSSPADLLITADVARLWKAAEDGLLQPVQSAQLEKVPAHLRDPKGRWFGLTKRARVIVWDKASGPAPPVASYQDLADPEYKGAVLIRSSGNVYNISLVAGLIGSYGVKGAEEFVRGLSANLARAPKGGDRDQMKALAAGEGRLAVTNTYYIGQLLDSQDTVEQEIGKRMGIIFPDQNGSGTHINVSGAGVVATSPNAAGAKALLEYLVSPTAQKLFAEANHEYPVLPGVAASPLVKAWGTFKEDVQPLENIGRNSAKALALADKAGWK